jgi:transposase-like protein
MATSDHAIKIYPSWKEAVGSHVLAVISAPCFRDEAAALIKMESIFWPSGPVCPHCGGNDRIIVVGGMAARVGLKRCLKCRKQFTVTVGTALESSHVPLNKWLLAAYMMAAIRCNSRDLQRELGITYKTAWHMTRRLRKAFSRGKFADWQPVAAGTMTRSETLRRFERIWKKRLTPRQLADRWRVPVGRLASC